jgi:hypothetical protein
MYFFLDLIFDVTEWKSEIIGEINIGYHTIWSAQSIKPSLRNDYCYGFIWDQESTQLNNGLEYWEKVFI